jgi:hypothetical protein
MTPISYSLESLMCGWIEKITHQNATYGYFVGGRQTSQEPRVKPMEIQINEAFNSLRRAAIRQADGGLADGQLLARFIEQRDKAAVTAPQMDFTVSRETGVNGGQLDRRLSPGACHGSEFPFS